MHAPKLRGLAVAVGLVLLTTACTDGAEDVERDPTAATEPGSVETSSPATTSETTSDAATTSEAATSAEEAVDSAQVCEGDAVIEAIEAGADSGTLEEMSEEPVTDALATNPILTSLAEAVDAAALTETLETAEALTVFAPTDCAFAEVDPATLEAVTADPTGQLARVLGLHVVEGEQLAAAQLTDGQELQTFAGETITVAVADDGNVTLQDGQAEVIVPDVATSNATVHIIDGVLLPPSE